MQRVNINANAFKLSAPGFDVSSTTSDHLIFDAFGGVAYNGVYLSGLFPSNQMVSKSGYFEGVVNFGKTFSARPQCLVRMIDVNHSHALVPCYLGVGTNIGTGVNVVWFNDEVSLTVQVHYVGSTFASQVGFAYAALQV